MTSYTNSLPFANFESIRTGSLNGGELFGTQLQQLAAVCREQRELGWLPCLDGNRAKKHSNLKKFLSLFPRFLPFCDGLNVNQVCFNNKILSQESLFE